MKSWVSKEMRNRKKATSGSLYEEEHVRYPFNPTSKINGKGGARRLDLEGDRSLLAHVEEGVFIRPEERVSLFEGEKALARGMPREKSRMLKAQENTEQGKLENLEITVTPEKPLEELPRLPPIRLKSEEKNLNFSQEAFKRGDKLDSTGSSTKAMNMEGSFRLRSFLDVPVGQEIINSGGKRMMGRSRLFVSQGIAEDASELIPGHATIGDGLSESVDYLNEYWDSDEYEDDEDLGYI
ncbi:hypothetical protein KI387_000931, partial [Taxus chinensis]